MADEEAGPLKPRARGVSFVPVRKKKGGARKRPPFHSSGLVASVEDNLNPAVLRLTDARASRHQKLGVTVSVHRNHVLRYAVADQFRGDRAGTPLGQSLVVGRSA